jgi:hypothetical protein
MPVSLTQAKNNTCIIFIGLSKMSVDSSQELNVDKKE